MERIRPSPPFHPVFILISSSFHPWLSRFYPILILVSSLVFFFFLLFFFWFSFDFDVTVVRVSLPSLAGLPPVEKYRSTQSRVGLVLVSVKSSVRSPRCVNVTTPRSEKRICASQNWKRIFLKSQRKVWPEIFTILYVYLFIHSVLPERMVLPIRFGMRKNNNHNKSTTIMIITTTIINKQSISEQKLHDQNVKLSSVITKYEKRQCTCDDKIEFKFNSALHFPFNSLLGRDKKGHPRLEPGRSWSNEDGRSFN